jgi:hypothetical protein
MHKGTIAEGRTVSEPCASMWKHWRRAELKRALGREDRFMTNLLNSMVDDGKPIPQLISTEF